MQPVIYPFPETQFCKTETAKSGIVLHHTVSSNAASSIAWWKQTPERVAVAFIIEKNGTIYQLYDPKYWAWHIGKGSSTADNQQFIGIELVNEGPLVHKFYPDFSLYWNDGKTVFRGEATTLQNTWRRYKYFAKYTDAQYMALHSLILGLCKTFSIPVEVNTSFQYDPSFFSFKGIVSHHNLRPDKTDVSPAFDFQKLIQLFKEG